MWRVRGGHEPFILRQTALCPAIERAMRQRAYVVPCHIVAMSVNHLESQHRLPRAPTIFLTPVTFGVRLWCAVLQVCTYPGIGSRRPHRGLAVLLRVHDRHATSDSRRGWCGLQLPSRWLWWWTVSFVFPSGGDRGARTHAARHLPPGTHGTRSKSLRRPHSPGKVADTVACWFCPSFRARRHWLMRPAPSLLGGRGGSEGLTTVHGFGRRGALRKR